jgi:hypothetical protein
MQTLETYSRAALVALGLILSASIAEAQMPMPTTATPTVHGGQTMQGLTAIAEVGFPAVRFGILSGDGGFFDWGVIGAAPTLGDADINGYFQQLGMDVRAPLRFRLLESSKVTGSLRVAPLFHFGRKGAGCTPDRCDPNVGFGSTIGFMMDIPLPKIFKVVMGVDTRWGMVHFAKDFNRFGGATMVQAGIEAFWKDQFFFQLIMHIGGQYISGTNGNGGNPVFRQLLGAGYKFK